MPSVWATIVLPAGEALNVDAKNSMLGYRKKPSSTALLIPAFWLLPYVAPQNLAHPLPRNTEPCLKLRKGQSGSTQSTNLADLLPG